jgi:hypothetical protein
MVCSFSPNMKDKTRAADYRIRAGVQFTLEALNFLAIGSRMEDIFE